MSLSPLFPHYGPLGSGPYYVSLAIPGAPSAISKSLGLRRNSLNARTVVMKLFAV